MTRDLDEENSPDGSYERDLKSGRRSVREALRTDRPAADIGFCVTIIAVTLVGAGAGFMYGLMIAGAFLAWFCIAFLVIRIGGGRGWNAARRAYIATFGWGNWI
ncbi:MAG TPA: hypothetical protein VIS09_11925 [Streptomyces sp.]